MGGGNLWAQTDVTSTYITNADFSSSTPISSNLKGYGKDGTPYGFQSVDGWTSVVTNGDNSTAAYPNSGMGSAVFAYGSSYQLQGNNKAAPASGPNGGSGNCLGFFGVWGCGGYYYQEVTLQPGAYTINIPVYNQSGTDGTTTYFGWTPDEGTASTIATPTSTGSWTTLTTSFTLTEETKGQIRVGYKSNGNGSGVNPHLFIDKVQILCSPFATSSDYEALNTAISAVEGKTWGFDAGEYAPYNYVEVIQALAEAQAIDQEANNSQATVQALTATLNTSMTANAAEVNAIWDPSFEHDYSGQSGNINPIGWQRVKDAAADGYNVRLMNGSNAGLAATSSGKALFTKQSAYYGYAEGYTMPLNASTYYTISFVYGGWGDCKKDGYVTISDPSSAGLTLLPSKDLPLDAVDGDSNKDSWKNYSAIFKTNDAGDYALGLRKKNYDTSGQSQYVYGDFVLKTTTVAEATAYYNTVKTSVEGDYDDSAYGGDEKTAFKNALDASMEGKSVAEIFAAASDLQTKHDTYVAAKPNYAKFIAEKNSAIAIGVTTEAANAVTMTTAAGLDDALHALYVLEDAAATSGYAVDATTLFGSWTTQNMGNASGQHWSDNASTSYFDNWSGSDFTSSITSTMTLPAGKYVFKVAGRAAANSINGAFNMSVKIGENDAVQKDFTAKGDTGYGIDTDGAVNYSDGGTYAYNGAGRGWEWRFIGFELDAEASVTMTAYAEVYANNWVSFTDATLLTTSDNVGVLKNLLEAELTVANGISTTVNVGTGAFQIPSSAVSTFEGAKTTAQDVYNNTDATSEQVSNAITALQTAEETYKNAELNAPADGARYRIKSTAATGASWKDKYYMLRPDASQPNGGYSTKADVAAADYLAIAWKFTAVTGGYTLSMTDADGATRYLCTNLKGYGQGSATQIRTTTDSEKALVVKVIAATGTDGRWFLQNTENNSYLGGQDAGLYSNSQNYDLAIEEASQASVDVNVGAGKVATRIFPFVPTLPSGVVAYSCSAEVGGVLTLDEVEEPAANTPYILYSEVGFSGDALSGWGTASADSYVAGWLTGVYTRTEVPENSYVLQTQGGKQAFYKVSQTGAYSSAYRAYVTVPAGVKAFYGFTFGDIETAIEAVREAGESTITLRYNAAGQKMNGARKGLNIVKMSDGSVRKVLVK